MIARARARVRIAARLVALALWTAALLVPALAASALAVVSRESRWRARGWVVRVWARGVARLIGMRIQVDGAPPRPPFLLVANHLSYVDVILLQASGSPYFVAKSEIARWPVIGPLARTGGTVFVDRDRRSELPAALESVERALRQGRGVAVFPEGTSTDGSGVGPFKSSFFEVAVRTGAPVYCATLGYRTAAGSPPAHLAVCWWGDMTFVSHLLALLALPSFEARLCFGEVPISSAGERKDRKELASRARRAVASRFTPVSSPV